MSDRELAHAVEEQQEPGRLWLLVAAQKKRLGLAARRNALAGRVARASRVPDLSLELMMRLAHGAMAGPGRRELDGAPARSPGAQVRVRGQGEGPRSCCFTAGRFGQLDGADGPGALPLVPG